MPVIEHIIREPFVEARCVPLREGGWQVTTARGTTKHPHAGDPWLALDRHFQVLGHLDGQRWRNPETNVERWVP